MVDIGEVQRTFFIEPIEEPAEAPAEPSFPVGVPEPADAPSSDEPEFVR